METDHLNLSGAWKGFFNYPRALPPTQFDAELRDQMGALTGETFEIGNGRRNNIQPMHALIEGRRNGDDVSFVKHYDDFKRARTPVRYSGTVNDDGTEIAGIWTIPGHWSGTFLMVRPKSQSAVIERKIAETVR